MRAKPADMYTQNLKETTAACDCYSCQIFHSITVIVSTWKLYMTFKLFKTFLVTRDTSWNWIIQAPGTSIEGSPRCLLPSYGSRICANRMVQQQTIKIKRPKYSLPDSDSLVARPIQRIYLTGFHAYCFQRSLGNGGRPPVVKTDRRGHHSHSKRSARTTRFL